jgi:4-azaleucine resistance transporter AzlC
MISVVSKHTNMTKNFKIGIKSSIPIFMGYFSIAITFGLITKSAGLPGYMALLMSMTNFTGATQFIALNMLTAGISTWSILLTTFMINARYFLMSFCLANKLPSNISPTEKKIMAFGITDEVFVLAMTRQELNSDFIFGSQLISWSGWVSGTFVGIIMADFIPQSIANSTGIAIYIMLLALILPAVKTSKNIAAVTLIGIVISSVFFYTPALKTLVGNWRIIITIIMTASIGAILFPLKESSNED